MVTLRCTNIDCFQKRRAVEKEAIGSSPMTVSGLRYDLPGAGPVYRSTRLTEVAKVAIVGESP